MADLIRVLLVDDYPLLQAGIRATLNAIPDMRLIGWADHTADAARLCAKLAPDVLLYTSPPGQPFSLDLLWALHQQFPALKLLVIAEKAQATDALAVLANGVCGILLKEDPLPLLELMIRTTVAGGVFLSPSIDAANLRPQVTVPGLSDRHIAILQLIARGWDNLAIAAQLHLAPQTIRNYISQIYATIGVSTRAEAVVWALEHGFGPARMEPLTSDQDAAVEPSEGLSP